MQQRHGFTLIELSIALVIIGLIVGGIMVGQDMIRSSELRTVTEDIAKYSSAVKTFKLKYKAMPGDMPNATDYWGAAAANCTIEAGTGTQTCNGNGNRYLDGSPYMYEPLRFWQHLSNSGIIPGNYTGVTGPIAWGSGGGWGDFRIGVNCPKGGISEVGYSVGYMGAVSGAGYLFNGFYGKVFVIGAEAPCCETATSAFTGLEAQSIDRKVDDGKPGTGNWIPRVTAACTTGTDATPTAAAYVTINPTVSCMFYVKNAI